MKYVTSINVSLSSIKLEVGDWGVATATVLPSDATKKFVKWSSDNTAVASVNETTGDIQAIGIGSARIIATATDGSNVTGSCTVTVVPATVLVSSISLNKTNMVLNEGEYDSILATVLPENATNRNVEWTSDDETIATVTWGTVSGIKVGTTTVRATATDGSGKCASCTVTVESVAVPVQSVTIPLESMSIKVGAAVRLRASVSPGNATNSTVNWRSEYSNIASIDQTGCLKALSPGTTRIYATSAENSSLSDYCNITVEAVPVESVEIFPLNPPAMNVGETVHFSARVYPSNADQTVTWSSSDDSVAEVNTYSGKITAKKAGIVTITATTADGGYSDSREIWVKGKTPVFLIHGRTSNSKGEWGINNNIPSGQNNHFNSDVNALSLNSKKYTDVNSQALGSFEPNKGDSDTDYPCNLGNKLIDAGYKKNINLFAFNYPNQDAVVHSANKFKKYIENLIDDVRTSGTDEKKACFYASRNDYDNNNYKINIVGHSMGGLVARYFIENLYQDTHVDKLITICTPHWGSGYADFSNWTSIEHKLCDHDLDFDSIMFGGSNPNDYKFDENGCQMLINDLKCIDHAYELSNELQYSKSRNTRYYAIAGIDYPGGPITQNDYCFEMSTNYTTYQQIDDFMVGKQVYRYAPSDFDPKSVGDNMVGFMSQIGWTENIGNTPNKKIPMEKIFIDVDTNGGNGGGVFIWEVLNGLGSEIFHNKAPHRTPVCNKVIEYLED